MRGRVQPEYLLHHLQTEKTARENQIAVWLAHLVEPSSRTQFINPTPVQPETITMGDVNGGNPRPPPARPMMGYYGLAANRGQHTHVFLPENHVSFGIKISIQNGLKENQYDGRYTMSPHEHLSYFYETCQLCIPPLHVNEYQKKLRLFAFTLTGRAKDWLLSIPSGNIKTWDEL